MNSTRVSRHFFCAFISMLFFAHVAFADDWDPQDDAGTNATVLPLNETYQSHGPHSLDASDTNDWFLVQLTAGMPCRFESSSTLDTKAFLYSDATGTVQVASDDQSGAGNNFLLRYLPQTSGTYYLKVREFISGSGGDYTLHYGFYAADGWDPADNVPSNGTLLTMGEAAKIHGSHVLDEFDYFDWFHVNLSSGIVYRFESVGGVDTWGGIYSDPSDTSDEAAEAFNDDGPVDFNFQFDYSSPSSSVYYVKVRAYAEGDTDAYDLQYYVPANDSEPDQLPDSWEIQYFSDLSHGPTGLEGDTDQFTNLEEYIAGTDPTNSTSFFAVTNGLDGSRFVVKWSSVASREYKVLWAENLTNTFDQLNLLSIEDPQNSYRVQRLLQGRSPTQVA